MKSLLLFAAGEVTIKNASIFDPAAAPAESIRGLAILVLVISAFIFVVVESVFVYNLVHFRKSRVSSAAEPPQVYGATSIEVAWTVAPALIVFILVLVSTRTLYEVEARVPEPALDDDALFVTVIGRQWWWEFRYEKFNGRELGFVTANELHIPAATADGPRPVYLSIRSADVAHSFWMPRLAGKMDAIPGRTNHLWIEAREPGLYVGQCAEFCGTQHANMLLRVVAQTPADFDAWLENQRQPAVEDPDVAAGKVEFLKQSCVNCHRVRGTTARGSYAPDLTHLMSRETLAAGVMPNNRVNLDAWIRDPQHDKPGALMPAFGLTDRQREQIVDYLLTLR